MVFEEFRIVCFEYDVGVCDDDVIRICLLQIPAVFDQVVDVGVVTGVLDVRLVIEDGDVS